MNTKTMRLPPRRVLTPSGTTNKRKEREDSFERPKPVTTSKFLKPDRSIPRPGPESQITTFTTTSTSSTSGGGSKGFESSSSTPFPSSQLLAGFLAHEYLTKGTLMGHPWASSRAEGPTTATATPIEKKKEKAGEDGAGGDGRGRGEAMVAPPCRRATTEEERERYAKVAGLMMGGGGAHLPGAMNPTQLARFLQL